MWLLFNLLLLVSFHSGAGWQHFWNKRCKPALVGTAFAASCWVAPNSLGDAWAAGGVMDGGTTKATWELMNGSVTLPDPLALDKATKELRNPQLIGVGGGGAVFTFDNTEQLIKVSWEGSAKSVERECKTLQLLEANHVDSAERCLATYSYTDSSIGDAIVSSQSTSTSRSRVMILVEPYVPNAVASIGELPTEAIKEKAVVQIARTLVQMLAANIITIDVQPLISPETGRVILIDMTEAQQPSPPYGFLDETLMTSFATETTALIPEQYMDAARRVARNEMQKMEETTALSELAKRVLEESLFCSEG